ncbi:hypothetical protein HJ588_04030 [Flexivirga sp. ID2601S]|uniref:Protein kinase domain-containing protein n=1 Tax=Flexivirga aerilata TaxID=1656889 RepID=A0A849AF34_9MICO|nr:hypothetical protein [Flexivirga aerilata]NNG38443.1 hypothetical protein [Flexivirga aerilata]
MQGIGEDTVLADRYTLTRMLAQRDDQELWIAFDSTLDREVTATVFRATSAHADAALDSARRAAGVEDHHLPRVLDVGVQDGTAYVITEALHGAESMASLLQFDRLPAEEVRRLIGEAASGLGAAAARGLHHLRLTPHDIVRSPDGAVSVLGLPTDAALAGTDDVSSDEASRIDTVALVEIAYAGLTSRWPGDEPVPGLLDAERRADGELPAPSELAPGVPGDLDTLCRTTLGADEGPRTPGELARQLAPWSSERVSDSGRRPSRPASAGPAAALQSVPGGAPSATRMPGRPALAKAPDDRENTDAATDSRATAPVPQADHDADETAQISRSVLDAARERTARPPAAHDDDYDPSFTELEPPVPGLTGRFEPDRSSSKLALLLVALLVLVAVVFAFIGLRGIGGGSDKAAAGATSQSASPSASASASRSASPSSSPSPSATPIDITYVGYYGTGSSENPQMMRNVIDGDPSTYWQSFRYGSAALGGVKSGTGLLLNLGSSQKVGSIKITTTGGPSTINFYVTDEVGPVSTKQPAATLTGSGTQTATLNDATGKYITVWVTQLSQQDTGEYRERINEIQVLS